MIRLNRSYKSLLKRLFGVENDDVASVNPGATPVFDVGEPAPARFLSLFTDAFQFTSLVFDLAQKGNFGPETLDTRDFSKIQCTGVVALIENGSGGAIDCEFFLQHRSLILGNLKNFNTIGPVNTGNIPAGSGTSIRIGDISEGNPINIPCGGIMAQNELSTVFNYSRFRVLGGFNSGAGDPDIDVSFMVQWLLVPRSDSPFPLNKYRFVEGSLNDFNP